MLDTVSQHREGEPELTSLHTLTAAAEAEWLDGYIQGPTEPLGPLLAPGTPAPSSTMLDERGVEVELSDFWKGGPALIMFWRHFGCGCGIERNNRLQAELESYAAVGLNPVIVSQGEPARAAEYRVKRNVPCPILSDPNQDVYRSYGVGHFGLEQIYYADDIHAVLGRTEESARETVAKRDPDRTLVDDPWRASAEFVVGQNGIIRLAYAYQWCEDFPHPGILTTAAELSRT